ncbi:MAG TPA: hypothetical protein VNI36_00595 [Candidatus Dormibacteraeota bacterium]|nr:hypothetical protein [Candidatus Dormibacteraeota bacterium]
METCPRCALWRTKPADRRWRSHGRWRAALLPFSLFLAVITASAQVEGPPHPRATAPERASAPAPPARPELPAQIALPVKKPIPVVLDTPLSTLVSKQGEVVKFRLTYSILLGNSLEIPPDTEFLGHIVEVKRSGHFGKPGVIHLAVDRVRLEPGGETSIQAHLDSTDLKGQRQFANDKPPSHDARGAVLDTAGGALLGAAIGGAKGAVVGAGAGAAVAVLILMSRRGQDFYLQAGTPFTVTLDQPAYLSGAAVYAAQQNFKKNDGPSTLEPDAPDDGMPRLKRRGGARD